MPKLLLIIVAIISLSACGSSIQTPDNKRLDVGHLQFIADQNEQAACIVHLNFQAPDSQPSINAINTQVAFGFDHGQRLGSRTLDLGIDKTETFAFSQSFTCDKLNIDVKINHCLIADESVECPQITISGDQAFNKITVYANR